MSLRSTRVTAATTVAPVSTTWRYAFWIEPPVVTTSSTEQHPCSCRNHCTLHELVGAPALGLLAHHEPLMVITQERRDTVRELVGPQGQSAHCIEGDPNGRQRVRYRPRTREAEVLTAAQSPLGVDEVATQLARGQFLGFVEPGEGTGSHHLQKLRPACFERLAICRFTVHGPSLATPPAEDHSAPCVFS